MPFKGLLWYVWVLTLHHQCKMGPITFHLTQTEHERCPAQGIRVLCQVKCNWTHLALVVLGKGISLKIHKGSRTG